MKEILFWIVASGIIFLLSIILLIIGLVRKKKLLIFSGVFTFLAFIGSAYYTGNMIMEKSVRKVKRTVDEVKENFEPRTGEEIYTALFGKPDSKCLKIIDYQDQKFPVIDYAIWLHFKTCPEEMDRILSNKGFSEEKVLTGLWNTQGPNIESWFKPEQLGDTILMYKYLWDEYTNYQIIYCNLEKTEAYCQDVRD